jgi:hypothetical protein
MFQKWLCVAVRQQYVCLGFLWHASAAALLLLLLLALALFNPAKGNHSAVTSCKSKISHN